ncbi:response regulator [Thiorhodospira sibirica]|uniref:response regulator n=1 Tax=Thiorhodospira sibirica TaxID=154347 RepID=UPI00022C0489|nr:response regulator [Thiorhodospira sibirica]
MKILVVDDDPIAAEMIAAILEDAGHVVIQVGNGMEAIEAIESASAFDLIISDMNMPLISGIELFHTLQSQGIDTPFMLLTGDDPTALKDSEPGLSDCLKKDFDLDVTLIQSLERLFL